MDILINLLPPAEKEELKNLRRVGVVLKIGFSAVCAMAVFIVFMFFTMKAVQIQEDVIVKEISRFEKSESYKEVREAQDSLREYSKIASKVKSGLNNQQQRWDIIHQINQIIPEDMRIIEFSIDDKNVLLLKGVAYNREALLFLKEGLEKSENLSKIESPISNFVAEKDVTFEFTAEVK